MRSKEVDEAIEDIKGIDVRCFINGMSEANTYIVERAEKVNNNIDTVLSYIETLEKQIPTPSNEVPVEYQTSIYVDKRDAVMKSEIRDKIKDIEMQIKGEKTKIYTIPECFLILKTLKSIIGE